MTSENHLAEARSGSNPLRILTHASRALFPMRTSPQQRHIVSGELRIAGDNRQSLGLRLANH